MNLTPPDLTKSTSTQEQRRYLTPKETVTELDRYIVGQPEAKRAVAIALRNRWRRQRLTDNLRQEVSPKNILMIGPTGVGKTEIARRVAHLVNAPFLKVEATKFTEVGYVGRDVDSIIRDLVDIGISLLHRQRLEAVQEAAASSAVERLADILVEQRPPTLSANGRRPQTADSTEAQDEQTRRKREATIKRRLTRQRNQVLELLAKQAIEEETIELEIEPEFDAIPMPEYSSFPLPESPSEALGELLEGLAPRRRSRRVSVREARQILTQQEAHRLVDFDAVIERAIAEVEENGIVFIDEIDKTINNNDDFGPDVSGEGVQRDLLPIVEGAVVMTRYGPVRTDHMLFIAAGSFHSARPSDLIPELQGRFPIRVELSSLSIDDLYAILVEPENALTKQYIELLKTEGVDLVFSEDGLQQIAQLAFEVNERTEDIGARRLHTIVERVLEDVSFEAPERAGQRVIVDANYVQERIGELAADEDLSNFIL